MTITPLGDSAIVVTVGMESDEGLPDRVRAIVAILEHEPPTGALHIVPGFGTVTVFYDLSRIGSYEEFCSEVLKRVSRADARFASGCARTVDVPVCYGGEFGPDVAEVAGIHGLDPSEVIALHSGGSYAVQAIGFAPGFGYLGGLDPRIHTPRRATPRTRVAGGSVGIGGVLTAVYPFDSPGGWNIIGRTPLRMFDPARDEPSLLRAGDRVRFYAITQEEFASWK